MRLLKDGRSRNGIIVAFFFVLLCWGATENTRERYGAETISKVQDYSIIEQSMETAKDEFADNLETIDAVLNHEIKVAPEVEAQLYIMAKSLKEWEETNQNQVGVKDERLYYTVTDLDQNGRLELIFALCLGSGHYTDAYFYEINEEYDRLVACDSPEQTDMGVSDIIVNEAEVYYNESEDIYHYVFYDYERYGTLGNCSRTNHISLKDGKVVEERIASCETIWASQEDGDITQTFFADGKEITEAEYDALVQKSAMDMKKMAINLDWEYDMDTSTEETILADLRKAISGVAYEYPLVIAPVVEADDIDITYYSEGIFCVGNWGKYGYIKENGVQLTDYIFDEAYPFSDGLACVKVYGKYGYIDENGEVVIPFIYDDAATFQEGLAYFATEDSYGFLNRWGEVSFSLDCDSVSSFKEGLAYYSINGKYGYMDKTGNTVIEPVYSDADYFENSIAFVDVNGYKGAINVVGEVVIPFQYDILKRENDVILAATRELTGEVCEYFDLTGAKITKEEYETRSDKENAGKGYYVDANECIVMLDACEDVDISDGLLKNSVTPRIKEYWKLAIGQPAEVVDEEGKSYIISRYVVDEWWIQPYVRKVRLYDIDNSGTPILYCYVGDGDVWRVSFPLSNSGFYTIQDGKVYQILNGEECGGSARGDYVCLWKAIENGELYIGLDGAAGGFGGYADYSSIYTYEDGIVEEISSVEWVCQVANNYYGHAFDETPYLFYNDEYEPHSKETLKEAEKENDYVTACYVNDEIVSFEAYREECSKYVGVYFFD